MHFKSSMYLICVIWDQNSFSQPSLKGKPVEGGSCLGDLSFAAVPLVDVLLVHLGLLALRLLLNRGRRISSLTWYISVDLDSDMQEDSEKEGVLWSVYSSESNNVIPMCSRVCFPITSQEWRQACPAQLVWSSIGFLTKGSSKIRLFFHERFFLNSLLHVLYSPPTSQNGSKCTVLPSIESAHPPHAAIKHCKQTLSITLRFAGWHQSIKKGHATSDMSAV